MAGNPDGTDVDETLRRQEEMIAKLMNEVGRPRAVMANQQAVLATAGVIDANGNPVQGGQQAGLTQVLNALLQRIGGDTGGDGHTMLPVSNNC